MIPNKIFPVNGEKIATLCLDTDTLKLSSQEYLSYETFKEGWDKKITLATKTEIKLENIKSISKEQQDETVKIKHKTFAGLAIDAEFSFTNPSDCEEFMRIIEENLNFDKKVAELSPFKAIQGYIIGFLFTIGMTIFSYFQALEIANGTATEASGRKGRAFQNIIGMLGDKGVLLIGTAITAYIGYEIWKRYKNPPIQIQLVPQG